MMCSNSRRRLRACWVLASLRRRCAPRRHQPVRWAPCWTTPPVSSPPARSGCRRMGAISACRSAALAAPGCLTEADQLRRRLRHKAAMGQDRVHIINAAGHCRLAGQCQRRRAAPGSGCMPLPAARSTTAHHRQVQNQIVPYLRSPEVVDTADRRVRQLKTIDWAVNDGLGSYFWQHNC